MRLTIIKFIIQLLFRVEVKGNYLGGSDKTLIIANHTSFLDGLLLALFLPVKPLFVVHRESTTSYFFRWLLNQVDYLMVDSERPMAMRSVLTALNDGRAVVIFPEGRVTVTGSLMKLYDGAAYAAMKTQATIIPIHISGAQYSYFSRLSRFFNLRAFPKLRLTIFPPQTLVVDTQQPKAQIRKQAREEMHRLMQEMMVNAREPITLFDLLLKTKKNRGGEMPLFKDEQGESLTYSQFIQKAVSLSVLFNRKFNLAPRVGLMLPNTNAVALTFYALQHCAKTPVIINYTAGSRAVCAGLLACRVKTVITSRQFVEKADLGVLIDNLSDYQIIYLEDLRQQVKLSDKLVIAIKRLFPSLTADPQKPSGEAVVLFTSGTEGLPKGVVHSHESLAANLAQIKAIYDFTTQDNMMICLPTFHVFGLMGGLILPISVGCRAFLYPSPLHYRTIPERIYEHNCTTLLSTSTFLEGYARYAQPYDFRSLRYVIAGAEKLSPEVVKTYLEKFGIRILEGYGATEMAPVITANTVMENRLGSVGKLLPTIDAEIVPVEGIATGGKLVLRSDNVMLGYLRADNPGIVEHTPVVNNKRQYDTGDIVTIDDDGFVHIQGRVKRFAKLAGEMISLDMVEKMAEQASSNFQHAAISLADHKKGELIVLFTTDKTLTVKHLQQSAKALGMPKLAIPRKIISLDEIPVFASGKTNYPDLLEKVDT